MPKLPAPPLPAALKPKPKRPGEGNGKTKPHEIAAEAGIHAVDWVDERTSLSGGLRWLHSSLSALEIRAAAERAGGHATLFRARDKSVGAFTPLDPVRLRLHRELKRAFDPAGILNPGRMYAQF